MLQLGVGYKRGTHPSAGRRLAEAIVTPRLACVRPAASVHPEPGSNSSLYKNLICSRFFTPQIHLEFQVTSLPISYFNIFKELCSANFFAACKDKNFIFSPQNLSAQNHSFLEHCFSKADAKISAFFSNHQTISGFFFEKPPLS